MDTDAHGNELKIIQIGFNKCGTTSFHKFFSRNGLRSVHWDNGLLGERVVARQQRGEDPFADYPDVRFFADMECVIRGREFCEGYRLFDYIFKWYPRAYYILNTRNPSAWLRSRMRHRGGQYIKDYMFHTGIDCVEDMLDRWLLDWHEHHARVLKFFREHDGKLLYFDIDRDPIQRVIAFLGGNYKLNPRTFTHEHRTDLSAWQKLERFGRDQRRRLRAALS